MKSIFIRGFAFAALAVILGAFGAHTLKTLISPEQLQTFETGILYQFYHSFALIICGLLYEKLNQKLVRLSANLFTVGICCFSFSVYLLACRDLLGIQSWWWLGPVTPFGGMLFISAWVILLVAAIKLNEK